MFFVVYPFSDVDETAWARIRPASRRALGGALVEDRFSFQSGVTGRLYSGLVQANIKVLRRIVKAEPPSVTMLKPILVEKKPAGRPRRPVITA